MNSVFRIPYSVLAICYCLSTITLQAQLDSNLTVRLQVELIAANHSAALTFSNALANAVPQIEVRDPERKASAPVVRSDGDGPIRILGTYILRDYATATNIAAQVTAARSGLSGRIHVHLCPLEGSIKDWAGCDADRRARAHEIKL